MFRTATAFNQQLCWDLTGISTSYTSNMFSGSNGGLIVCPPTSQPTSQPTRQPVSESTANTLTGAWVGGHLLLFAWGGYNYIRN